MSMIGLGYLRRVVGVELNLVHGRGGLEARVGKELLEVLDGEVGNTNVLLELSPRVEEVPVGQMLLEVVGVGR
jgi:hypothetical protein